MELDIQDLSFCIRRMPKKLVNLMRENKWQNKIFVGGGFIRSVITNEPINDIDLFSIDKTNCELLAHTLVENKKHIHRTDNAYTLLDSKPTLQIIDKWTYNNPIDVANSFDFTICSAVIFHDGVRFQSYCDPTYYSDLAGKRLVYKSPIRIEEAGGSTLRVLKYYQKGFRIPLDSFGAVLARLFSSIDIGSIHAAVRKNDSTEEVEIAKVITGLLRSVDPNIDPLHEAHLPSTKESNKITNNHE